VKGLEKGGCGRVVFKGGYTQKLTNVTTREGVFFMIGW
jgi:hypothetical protein